MNDEITASDRAKNEQQESNQPKCLLQLTYVKHQACQVPHAPTIYHEKYKPEVQVEFSTKPEMVGDSTYEVVLRLHVTAKLNQRTAYTLEVQQGGIFKITGYDASELPRIINIECPRQINPYLRAVVAKLTHEAGFPSLTLPPIDFDALYRPSNVTGEESQKSESSKWDALADSSVAH